MAGTGAGVAEMIEEQRRKRRAQLDAILAKAASPMSSGIQAPPAQAENVATGSHLLGGGAAPMALGAGLGAAGALGGAGGLAGAATGAAAGSGGIASLLAMLI